MVFRRPTAEVDAPHCWWQHWTPDTFYSSSQSPAQRTRRFLKPCKAGIPREQLPRIASSWHPRRHARPTCATSRGCCEDATRKLLPWNSSLTENLLLDNICKQDTLCAAMIAPHAWTQRPFCPSAAYCILPDISVWRKYIASVFLTFCETRDVQNELFDGRIFS